MPVWVWGWLEAFSFLQTVPSSHGTTGFGSANWTFPDQTGDSLGLGGSKPLVLFRVPLKRPEALALLRGLPRKTRFAEHRGSPQGLGYLVPHSKGDLTDYSPAACRAHRAAHSCLWDWELCRPPKGFGLRSCLACRLRRVRPARRPRAHSV